MKKLISVMSLVVLAACGSGGSKASPTSTSHRLVGVVQGCYESVSTTPIAGIKGSARLFKVGDLVKVADENGRSLGVTQLGSHSVGSSVSFVDATSDKTCPLGFETPQLRRSQLYTITVSDARWSSADKTEYTWSFTQREVNSSNYQIELPYTGD